MLSPLPTAWRLALLSFLAAASCAWAQTTYSPLGGEYSITGLLPGDQVRPAVALNSTGGLLVWQDVFTDEQGNGISAQRLDANQNPLFGRFRINQIGAGDQELAQVAALAGGGYIVVWQGGTDLDKDIFARILQADGTFLTGDIRINTFTSGRQITPAVAVLGDGSIVVVWASEAQDGSRFGVYGQRLLPSGALTGSEFRVNVTTGNNQFRPSVAPRGTDGFVVGWVDEQPPTPAVNGDGSISLLTDNVHAMARIFLTDGTPVTGELRLDTATAICGSPALSALDKGGFLAAWSSLQRASTTANSAQCNVLVRAYQPDGTPVSAPQAANVTDLGVASASGGTVERTPVKLAGMGTSAMVVWDRYRPTSGGLDVYGAFVDATGLRTGGEFLVNTKTNNDQIQATAASCGSAGSTLVVWTGFDWTAAQSGLDLSAQRYYVQSAVPTPDAPAVMRLGLGSLTVTWPALAGFSVQSYELYVDGATSPVLVGSGTTSYSLTGLAPSSTHQIQLAYLLSDGRTSALSPIASGTTWGADANGDGLPDDWEVLYFGKDSSNWPSPNADSDGDGVSNYNEFLAGTNPTDATSVLRTQVVNTGSELRLNWNVQAGQLYQVQFSTNLVTWTSFGAPRLAAGTSDSVPIDRSNGVGYYRIVLIR